jgi:hypothetical protein
VEMEEWSGKEKVMKQKGKLREKKEEKIFIDNETTDTEETKNHRERRKNGRERSKSGI